MGELATGLADPSCREVERCCTGSALGSWDKPGAAADLLALVLAAVLCTGPETAPVCLGMGDDVHFLPAAAPMHT